jgi:hypothetical protein
MCCIIFQLLRKQLSRYFIGISRGSRELDKDKTMRANGGERAYSRGDCVALLHHADIQDI